MSVNNVVIYSTYCDVSYHSVKNFWRDINDDSMLAFGADMLEEFPDEACFGSLFKYDTIYHVY